jgi:hypothetical protein
MTFLGDKINCLIFFLVKYLKIEFVALAEYLYSKVTKFQNIELI